MSKRDRHDSDRRGDRRDSQPDDEQQRRPGEPDLQESDSLTALKAILSKVASVLHPLQLNQEESIRLVEQLYASVLETDVRLAGEADETRKSSILAYIQNTSITRENGKLVVEHQTPREAAPEAAAAQRPAERPMAAERPTTTERPAVAERQAAAARSAAAATAATLPAETNIPPETTAPVEAPPPPPAEKRAPSAAKPKQGAGPRTAGPKRSTAPKPAKPAAEPATDDQPAETTPAED